MKYKNVDIFQKDLVNPEDEKLPIFVGERRILVAYPGRENNKEVYDRLLKNFEIFLSKVPSTPAKNAVQKLFDRNLIFMGRDVTTPAKNGIIGSFLINRTKFAGIVLDTVELEIDFDTGETSNIDMCFYTAYFEFIRAAVSINSKDVKANKALHDYLIKYMNFIYLRLIGINVTLSPKQKQFLMSLCSFFFYRFMIGLQLPMAKENVLNSVDLQYKDEVKVLLPRLEKYKTTRDIFKGLVDFSITQEAPASIMMKGLSKFRPTVFYALTSSLDYLIALSIVSKYPMKLFKNAVVSNTLQDSIEAQITPLINKTQFDTTAISGL